MAQLTLWLAICLAVAWVGRARVEYLVAGVIVLWSLVPAVAGHHLIGLSGGGIAFHPATWLVLSVFAVQLILHPRPIGSAMARHYLVVVAVSVFVLGALLTSLATGSGGTRLLMDQILGPFLLWWLIVAAGYRRRPMLVVVRNAILLAMAVQSVLALVQLAAGRVIFYAADYETLVWFKPETFDRWMGTADSPLVLALGVCVAGALAVGLRSSALRFSLLALYLIATILTQSRTGTVVLSAIIVYAIVRSRMAIWARGLAIVGVAGLGYYLAGSALVGGLAGRFADDTGSVNARLLAMQFMLDNAGDFLLTGQGLISSYDIARNAGLTTSLESSYLMYVIDTGFLLATVYFGCQLAIIARYGLQRAARGVTVAALVGALLQHTFSAVAFANMSGTLIWAALALVVVAWSLLPAADAHGKVGAPAASSALTSPSS